MKNPLPIADRLEADWNDARRAVAHALACGPRLGWSVAEGTRPEADLDDALGVGDAITVTYRRGTGRAAQRITARFRAVPLPGDAVDFYRFVGGEVALCAGTAATTARTWGHIMAALYSIPVKAVRAPRGARRTARRP